MEHLRETQKLSVVTIEAVIYTGELLTGFDHRGSQKRTTAGQFDEDKTLPPNIDKKRSYMYQTLKKKETEVRELVEKALEGEGIPMWRAILAKLSRKKQEDFQAPS